MEQDEDAVRPVKIYHQQKLEVKPYNCLICGKRADSESLRTPGDKGITAFVGALEVRGECNGFPKNDYMSIIDFDNKTLIGGNTDVRWHPKCYSSFCNSKHLSYIVSTSQC